jgi:hypothetical protein
MLSYAEAETVLAGIYGATGKAQAGAFRGRLKHLKRLGIPLGVSPGRGKKIAYGRNELYQWCFCLELSEFGIDPSIIAKLVRTLWKRYIFPGFNKMRERPASEVYYFWLPSEFMSASWRTTGQFRGIGSRGLGWGLLRDLPLRDGRTVDRERLEFRDLFPPVARLSLFDVSTPLRVIDDALDRKENKPG